MLDKHSICVGCKANLAPSQRDLDHTTSRDLDPQPLGKRTRKIALFVQAVRESALEAHHHGLVLDKYNTHIDCKANIAPSQRDVLKISAGVVKKTRKIASFRTSNARGRSRGSSPRHHVGRTYHLHLL